MGLGVLYSIEKHSRSGVIHLGVGTSPSNQV